MNMYEEKTDLTVENAPAGLKTTRRKIMAAGVQLFDVYYYNPAFAAFRGEEVEIRYDVKKLSKISVVLPDFRVVEADTIAVFACEGKYNDDESLLKDSLKLTEVEAKNRQMEAALWQALEIRGIFAALSDPLTLAGEKSKLRAQYAEIEINIRAVLFEGGIQ